MTRAGFLQSVIGVAGAALSPGGSAKGEVKAEEFDYKGKHFLVSTVDPLYENDVEYLKRVLGDEFPGAKFTITYGLRIEEVRPLGTADIEAAVEAGVSRALENDRRSSHMHIEARSASSLGDLEDQFGQLRSAYPHKQKL